MGQRWKNLPQNINRLRQVLLNGLKRLESAENAAADDTARAGIRAGIADMQRKLALLADVQFKKIFLDTAHAQLYTWRTEGSVPLDVLRLIAETQPIATAPSPQAIEKPASKNEQQEVESQHPQVDLPDTPFYQPILENNIFASLGTSPVTQTPLYRLIGTILSATRSTAIIQHTQTQQTYHRSLGENIGDATLVDIQHKQITLEREGKQTTLTLPPHLWLGKF